MSLLYQDTSARNAKNFLEVGKNDGAAVPQKDENQSSGGREGFMVAARSKALRPFIILSSSYRLFTITDGAIRMIVLMHAYNKAFSALEVAIMFSLYELAGVFTNLAAGLMGARWGIKFTLIIGLSLQLLSYGLLFGWQDSWTKVEAMLYVTGTYMNVQLCVVFHSLPIAFIHHLVFIPTQNFLSLEKSRTNVCWNCKGFDEIGWKDGNKTCYARRKANATLQTCFPPYRMEKLSKGSGIFCWIRLDPSVL